MKKRIPEKTEQSPENIITNDCYFFKKKEAYHKVHLQDITFIQSHDNYCQTHTVSGETFLARIPISKLENRLPRKKFFRIHRRYLVQLNLIDAVNFNDGIVRIKDIEIPVSRNKRKELSGIFKML